MSVSESLHHSGIIQANSYIKHHDRACCNSFHSCCSRRSRHSCHSRRSRHGCNCHQSCTVITGVRDVTIVIVITVVKVVTVVSVLTSSQLSQSSQLHIPKHPLFYLFKWLWTKFRADFDLADHSWSWIIDGFLIQLISDIKLPRLGLIFKGSSKSAQNEFFRRDWDATSNVKKQTSNKKRRMSNYAKKYLCSVPV